MDKNQAIKILREAGLLEAKQGKLDDMHEAIRRLADLDFIKDFDVKLTDQDGILILWARGERDGLGVYLHVNSTNDPEEHYAPITVSVWDINDKSLDADADRKYRVPKSEGIDLDELMGLCRDAYKEALSEVKRKMKYRDSKSSRVSKSKNLGYYMADLDKIESGLGQKFYEEYLEDHGWVYSEQEGAYYNADEGYDSMTETPIDPKDISYQDLVYSYGTPEEYAASLTKNESAMNQYQAFKILRESGLVLEKKLRSEMTPEELADARAKSKARREKRKAVTDKSPSNKGDWAVCTFSPIPEYFDKYNPIGWDDESFKKILAGARVLVGYYPTKAIAEKIAMTIFEKEMDTLYKNAKKNDSSYGLEYNVTKLLVVKHTNDNRRWSSGRRGPGDSGYWYNAESDVSDKQSKIKQETLEKFVKEQKEEKERRDRAERWANSSWNPDSGRFRNVYAHH